jgi:hypothetical protein
LVFAFALGAAGCSSLTRPEEIVIRKEPELVQIPADAVAGPDGVRADRARRAAALAGAGPRPAGAGPASGG